MGLTRWKNDQFLSSNALKNIAIIAMFFDHLFSVFILHDSLAGSILRITGRIVAPIMCYLIAEGFHYTSNFRKYAVRLFLFAVVSHIPYDIYYGLPLWRYTSVIWGLFLGLIALYIVKKDNLHIFPKIFLVIAICIFAYPADWKYVSVLWIVFFGLFRGRRIPQMASFAVIAVVTYVVPTIIQSGWAHAYEFGVFLAVPLLLMYNGKQGKKSKFIKWSFYIFYPLHLLILYGLRLLLNV